MMTDKQLATVLNDMVVLIDTREKSISHIIAYFNTMGIKYSFEKLESGDYTYELPRHHNLQLDRRVLVERKNSLDEIIGNFTTNRERFIREFERIDDNQTMNIVLENATWRKIMNGTYRSKVAPNSLMANIHTWEKRYNCNFWFCTKEDSGAIIYNDLYYGLREILKNL